MRKIKYIDTESTCITFYLMYRTLQWKLVMLQYSFKNIKK